MTSKGLKRTCTFLARWAILANHIAGNVLPYQTGCNFFPAQIPIHLVVRKALTVFRKIGQGIVNLATSKYWQ